MSQALQPVADDRLRLRTALDRALADPDLATVRQALLIEGFADLTLDAYGIMLDMATKTAALGY